MNAIRTISKVCRSGMLCPAALLACVAVSGAAVPDPMKQGDIHDQKLQASQALACYLQVEQTQPQNAEVLLRIARQYRHLMADESSVAGKLKMGNKALEYANRAATLAPQNSDAVLSPAITYGKMIRYLPKKDQVAASRIVKTRAEKAASLHPKNDLAWHVLGRWHRAASDVGGVKRALAGMLYEKLPPASNAEAVKYLELAVKLNPNRLMHHIELGKAYAQSGRKEDARRHLTKGLSMPNREKDDPELKQSGREVLGTL